MRLPNGRRATIRPEKLTEYVLNPAHPVGKHKARLFAGLLGITAHNPEPLRQALQEAAASLEAVQGKADRFGSRYSVDFSMEGPRGTFVVRSAWIVREGRPPDLVTCFII